MSHVLVVVLGLNFFVEALAAASLIGGPSGIGASGAAAGERWSMHYGFAVIAIASASLWLWPRRRELASLTPVLGVLATFHSAVLISLAVAGDQPVGVGMHAILALLFVASFARRAQLAAG
jgi:hypothetical protein